MQIEVEDVVSLHFADGSPVRAASAVVPFGDGLLVAQDDATHAAWLRGKDVEAVRVLPAVDGSDTFEEAAGTKHLKPDLEAAFEAGPDGGVVLLGSGSSPARMRAVLVRPPTDDAPVTVVATDLSPVYASAARLLAVDLDLLNLEGACLVGPDVRWFQRGLPSAGTPTASVDVDLAGLLDALTGAAPASDVRVASPRHYELGAIGGVGLAVTDVVALPDGTLLVSAAAEDTADPRDDGPVVGSVLAVLDDGAVVAAAPLPTIHGTVPKVEGLALLDVLGRRSDGTGSTVRLLATIDSDDPTSPSLAVSLLASW
ncbi:MAG: hypothetical protein JWP95_168 [Actinotalea sp.]|nr:hypothetical protein [Actinotalea sp.]